MFTFLFHNSCLKYIFTNMPGPVSKVQGRSGMCSVHRSALIYDYFLKTALYIHGRTI